MELRPEARISRPVSWAVRHAAGLMCVLVGVVGFALTAALHVPGEDWLTTMPSVWLTVPFVGAALIAGIASLVRGEGARVLPLLGVSLAASAVMVGIALVLWALVFVTVGVILILSELM